MDVQDGDSFNHGVNIMSKTPTPTITITVSGPTGSGKSRVLAVIADVLKLIHSDCIIEAPDVKAEKEMCGDDHTAWHKPRSGTIFKLEEINQPINTGRCSTHDVETVIKKLTTARENLVKAEAEIRNKAQATITSTDLYDRPVPVRIQKLMNKLGISFEEYQETDLQPVVDLVNWALTTPTVPEQKQQSVGQHNQRTMSPTPEDMTRRVIELVDQQVKGSIDPVTARAIWYNVTKDGDAARLANYLTFALNYAVNRSHHKIMARGINTNGIPESLQEQELQAEKISHIYTSVMSQLYGKTDMVRAHKFWLKTLEEMRDNKALLVEILIQVITDINNQQDIAE
ncbi:hypothetical protein NDG61_005107 [Salmonella enterica]|nr:hypothetical protein [Salmonella enterica]EJI1585748.1 hypothetical protein [Salmonella enterica]